MNATLRGYIQSFRVAELTLCLQELGLSKKGLKGELQARLFAYFGDSNGVTARGVNQPRERHRLDTAGWLTVHGIASPVLVKVALQQ